MRRLIASILEEIDAQGRLFKDVAIEAGIHPKTLLRLLSGETENPMLSTVYGLSRALGLDLVAVRKKQHKEAA